MPSAPLDQDHARSVLAADELRRAQRLHFDRDRALFVLAHTMLRHVLAGYVGADPARLEFRHNPYGKPSLAGDTGCPPLEFNLSHSGDIVLLGLSRGPRIGVDIERRRVLADVDNLAATILSTAELASFRRLAAVDRQQTFFHLWTKKEALVKAVGKGLSLPPKKFAVQVGPGPSAPAQLDPQDADNLPHWSLEAIDVHPGYAAAIAVSAAQYTLRRFRWDLAGSAP
jgi:4'-phosphopantetheinyl transferase